MLTETLIQIFTRDLNALKNEIESYSNQNNLWIVSKGISNSAGNLCLHLIGNLNHYIGATLGKSVYIRKRDLEFSLKNVPRAELIEKLDDTIIVVTSVLKNLTTTDLQKEYTHQMFKAPMTTEFFLIHLTTHLAYHLGQINYHRRLLDV